MSKKPVIVFKASLEGAGCISIDGDGAAKIKLSLPASELANYSKLTDFREQELIVTVQRA